MVCQAYDWFLDHRAHGLQGPSHHRSGVKQGALAVVKQVMCRVT
jgi:hypothetical protein